jgi:hypothetical protein
MTKSSCTLQNALEKEKILRMERNAEDAVNLSLQAMCAICSKFLQKNSRRSLETRNARKSEADISLTILLKIKSFL